MNHPFFGRRGSATWPRAGRMSAAFALALVNLLALLGLAGWVLRPQGAKPPVVEAGLHAQDPAAQVAQIFALGRIQPRGGVISLFGPPGDRVATVEVRRGSQVAQGDLLVSLRGDQERELALKALRATVREAETLQAAAKTSQSAKEQEIAAEIAQAEAGLKAELAGLDAKLRAAELAQSRAKTELARLKTIQAGGVRVPDKELQDLQALEDQTTIELEGYKQQRELAAVRAAAAKKAAEAKLIGFQAETNRALAQIPIESARANLAAAEAKWKASRLVAPLDGRVLMLAAQPGDTVASLPLVQLANTDQMLVVAEVYESDVTFLRQALERRNALAVTIDSRGIIPGDTPMTGSLSRDGLSSMIARNTVLALDPRGDTDRRVVEVEIVLDGDSSRRAANWIGLQVRVQVPLP